MNIKIRDEMQMNLNQSYLTKFFTFKICLLMLCSACTRDPFGRYPEAVKNASPYTKDVYYLGHHFEKQIVFENIAKIETSDVWQTSVGDQLNMIITGHVLLEEEYFHNFDIELVSPPLHNEIYEFGEVDTGERDSKKKQYLFQWKPSNSFLGDDFKKVIDLRFRLTIVGKVNVSLFDTFPVIVYGEPILIQPTVVSIEHPSVVSNEDVCKIKVKVFDQHSSEEYPPIIDFVDVDERYDASELIAFSSKSQVSDHTWEFEYDFTAPSLEQGEIQFPYQLEALAISRFGVSSESKRSQLTVVRDTDKLPQITGAEEITVYTATTPYIVLQVQNPFNGRLSVHEEIVTSNSVNIPGSFIAHQREKEGYFEVTIIWNIPENTEEGEYEFGINMTYQWPDHNGYRHVKVVTHTIKANVMSIESLQQSSDVQEIAVEDLQ